MSRLEPWLIVAGVLLVTAVPAIVDGLRVADLIGLACVIVSGLLLVLWRRHTAWVLVCGGGLFLVAASLPGDGPDTALLLCTAFAFVAGYRFSGRSAWTSGAAALAWLAGMYFLTGENDVGLAMFTVPGFVAGTALRLRRETAEELALRGRELEAERELFAQLAVRNERARIASELHDIIGHSLSVMVVQAAAGQRMLQSGQASARRVGDQVLAVVSESADQGRADLARLVDLLGGRTVASPDLALVDEVVALAAGSGLEVACTFDGDHDGVDAVVGDLAFCVVREALTNAMRHAPGAAVSVHVTGTTRMLDVCVENDAPTAVSAAIVGSGFGLRGLRDRVESTGGRLSAGRTVGGGWKVHACLTT